MNNNFKSSDKLTLFGGITWVVLCFSAGFCYLYYFKTNSENKFSEIIAVNYLSDWLVFCN
jgi:hypothetical protein